MYKVIAFVEVVFPIQRTDPCKWRDGFSIICNHVNH